MNYQAGNASTFASMARERKTKYTYHYDHQYKQWNVFDPQGYYVCSFSASDAAKQFCDRENGEVHDAPTN